ncbi:MAG TPA: hypothetical protein VGD91_06670 [Trebonia sp.]
MSGAAEPDGPDSGPPGGMGQVFLGFSPAGRAVAVKVVHRELALDPEFRARPMTIPPGWRPSSSPGRRLGR